MTEYLQRFGKDIVEGKRWEEMLENNTAIERPDLIYFLREANYHLINEPGPNRETRATFAPDWIGWWIDHLSKVGNHNTENATLVPFNSIKLNIRDSSPTGVLFVGSGEGHGGHRAAIDWMRLFVKPTMLFEQNESEWLQKKGRVPFLPLEVRLSMWSYYRPDLVISVLPKKDKVIVESDHYQNLFDETGADYCFTTEGDPNQEEKRARGKPASFTLIPYLDVPSTTFRVQKLMG